jgi:hypothetical protein
LLDGRAGAECSPPFGAGRSQAGHLRPAALQLAAEEIDHLSDAFFDFDPIFHQPMRVEHCSVIASAKGVSDFG